MAGHAALPNISTDHTSLCLFSKLAVGAQELGWTCYDKEGHPFAPSMKESQRLWEVRFPLRRLAEDLNKFTELKKHEKRMIYVQLYKTGHVKFIGPVDVQKLVIQRLEYLYTNLQKLQNKEVVNWIAGVRALGMSFRLPLAYVNSENELIYGELEQVGTKYTDEDLAMVRTALEAVFAVSAPDPVMRAELLACVSNAFQVALPDHIQLQVVKEARRVKVQEAEAFYVGEDSALADKATSELKAMTAEFKLGESADREEMIVKLEIYFEEQKQIAATGGHFEETDGGFEHVEDLSPFVKVAKDEPKAATIKQEPGTGSGSGYPGTKPKAKARAPVDYLL